MSAMTGGVEDEVRYGVDAGVATITIDRPARRNALSWPVVAELRRRIAEAREDDAVRVVVLTGAGEQAFCAGADLGGMIGEDESKICPGSYRGSVAAA